MTDLLVYEDLLHQPSFDETAQAAAALLNTPMAAISLLGKECQWFKAEVGLNRQSTPIEHAFCRYTAASNRVMIVADATRDDRFADNPLVTSGTIRSYAGAPLRLTDGSVIGALCVLDTAPRDFDAGDAELLEVLARQVVGQLQLEALIDQQADTIADLEATRTQLKFEAGHDSLTRLLNRRGLETTLNQMIDDMTSASGTATESYVSIIFVDLDGFKQINDQYGHQVGDQVLVEVAKRMTMTCPGEAVMARFGGDEFLVAMVHDATSGVSKACLESLVAAIAEPMILDAMTVKLSASAGLACEPVSALGAADVIDRADRAMYFAKKHGRGQTRIWSATEAIATFSHPAESGLTEDCVVDVLCQDRVRMAFQPVVDLVSGRLLRREALVRWLAQPSTISPSVFIAAAEEWGHIKQLGRIALSQSCEAAASWQSTAPGVGVAVNISALQVDDEFFDNVIETLALSALDPELLTLELTETSLFDRSAPSVEVLAALADFGIRISLDDFGTGYSSMSMLCDLPIAETKIDRRFCSSLDERLMAVAKATIELSHSLGISVVAEGIESTEVRDHLVELGCDAGQGFLFGHPR